MLQRVVPHLVRSAIITNTKPRARAPMECWHSYCSFQYTLRRNRSIIPTWKDHEIVHWGAYEKTENCLRDRRNRRNRNGNLQTPVCRWGARRRRLQRRFLAQTSVAHDMRSEGYDAAVVEGNVADWESTKAAFDRVRSDHPYMYRRPHNITA